MKDGILGCCCVAVEKLDYLLRNHPAETAEELTEAVRCTVAVRERMIERCRRGLGDPAGDRQLRRVNMVISAIVAGEFPLTGIRWQRIAGARDLLQEVLSEEEARLRPPGG